MDAADRYLLDSRWAQVALQALLRKLIAEIAREHERRAEELRKLL